MTYQAQNSDNRAPGDLMRIRTQRRKSLPEAAKLTQVCQDAGFTKTVAKAVAKGQFFVTRSAIEVEGQGITACREYTHLRSEFKSSPKGRIGNNTKTGPALDVLVTEQFDHCGVDVKIDSLATDGSQSCVVISS